MGNYQIVDSYRIYTYIEDSKALELTFGKLIVYLTIR